MAQQDRPRKRGALRWVGVGALALLGLVLLVILLAGIFVATPLFEKTLQEQVLPMASERIEREVTVESASGWLIPARFRFEGLRVQGQGELPIVAAEDVLVRVNLWETLTSLGQVISLREVAVDGVHANLVRLEDGTWDLPTVPERPPDVEPREFRVDDATIRRGTARMIDPTQGLDMEVGEVLLDAWMGEDSAALERLHASVAGGEVVMSATSLLSVAPPSWSVNVELTDIDLGQLPQLAGTIDGTLSAETDLAGIGVEQADIFRTLTGTASFTLIDGRYLDLAFLEALAAEIAEFIYVPSGARPTQAEAVNLGSPVTGEFRIEDGWVQITKPPRIRAAFGGAEIGGRVALDRRLDLVVDIGLSTEFLSDLTGGLVEPDDPVPVTLRVEGTAAQPDLSLADTEDLEGLDPGFFNRALNAIKNLWPWSD